MKITRRQFLKYSGIAGAAAVLPWKMAVREAWAQYGFNSPNLTKFVDPIRMVGAPIPIAGADAFVVPPTNVLHYTIDIGQFNDVLHSDFITPPWSRTGITGWLPPPAYAYTPNFAGTKLWGFNQGGQANFKHLGCVIVAVRNNPIQITFVNKLPPNNIIPVDTTIPGANQAKNRTAIHIHGGYVPWISDGGPFDWFEPGAPNGTGAVGASFLNNACLNPGAPAGQAEYYYRNDQTARLVWYHDHAFGITRTNAYSGIASGYVIHDVAAEGVLTGQGIPSAVDLYSGNPADPGSMIYMVFQDKYFFGPAGPPAGYPANAGPGDLGYPYIYNTALFGPLGLPSFGGALPPGTPVPSCVPEMFGDTMLVNGTAYPVLTVQAKRYRIGMLNACNARFLNPRLVATAGVGFPNDREPAPNVAGPSFIQIGTEGGYLPAAVPVNGKKQLQLLIAPAERADLIVDFTGILPGTEYILYNDAPGPFPGGAAVFDYYPKNPKTPTSIPGFGANTRTLLKIKVVAGPGSAVLPATIILPANDPPIVQQTTIALPGVAVPLVPVVTTAPAGTVTDAQGNVVTVNRIRSLTLNEGFDEFGRLAQFLGTNTPTGVAPGFFGMRYLDATTENPKAGDVEVWEIANLTADAHPIHFHLVNVQILSRQSFSVKTYAGIPNFNGQPIAPDLNELGWKETVRMNPGEVTRVIMKFTLPTIVNSLNQLVDFSTVNNGKGQFGGLGTPPPSPRTGGNEYVWHCHILEHEEHDMMRPLVVT